MELELREYLLQRRVCAYLCVKNVDLFYRNGKVNCHEAYKTKGN